jgi:hypothetical protein
MSKKKIVLGVTAALILVGGWAASSSGQPVPVTSSVGSVATAQAPAPAVAPAHQLTAAQENAKQAAQSYIDISGFSHSGLIQQLVAGDGFSSADATSAVNSMTIDWNSQADKSAKSYTEIGGFSHSGIITQLEQGDGYTPAQAAHGAASVGL